MSITKFRATPRGRQHGLTLVEILITVVIMSVGLLGVAALHLTSLRNGYDSSSRSRATWLANDIADRMRANQLVAQQGGYNVAIGASVSGATIATTDVTQWKNQITQILGGGADGSINVTQLGTDYLATIIIRWTERGTSNPSASPSLTQLQVDIGL